MADFTMCDRDIQYLSNRLNQASAAILFLLKGDRLEQTAIIEKANLTTAIAQKELIRLEGAGLVNSGMKPGAGRRTLYSLTPSGKRLIELHESLLKGDH